MAGEVSTTGHVENSRFLVQRDGRVWLRPESADGMHTLYGRIAKDADLFTATCERCPFEAVSKRRSTAVANLGLHWQQEEAT